MFINIDISYIDVYTNTYSKFILRSFSLSSLYIPPPVLHVSSEAAHSERSLFQKIPDYQRLVNKLVLFLSVNNN